MPQMQPHFDFSTPRFDGPELTQADHLRLTGQLARIYALMEGGAWWTLRCLAVAAEAPESSCSAQIRNLRKSRFGGHAIERKHLGSGLYVYRMVR